MTYYEESGEMNEAQVDALSGYLRMRAPSGNIAFMSTMPSHNWLLDFLPIEHEAEPHLGFTRESFYQDGKRRVKRVPIVHG